MQSLNDAVTKLEPTNRIFSQFYDTELSINGEEYDVVLSYLRSICTTKRIAENLAVAIFKIAKDNDLEPLTLLADLKGQDRLKLTANLSYFLNSARNPSVFLAVGTPNLPLQYAARNVVL